MVSNNLKDDAIWNGVRSVKIMSQLRTDRLRATYSIASLQAHHSANYVAERELVRREELLQVPVRQFEGKVSTVQLDRQFGRRPHPRHV